jgi:ribosomal protein S18 acetylase RimI-like enzyme
MTVVSSGMSPSIAIRRAVIADARSLALLAERTFREAFGDVNSPEDMALHCERSYREELQASEIANPEMVTLLGEQGGQLVGFAQVRLGQAPGCVGGAHPGEIQRLYVVGDCHGKGVAHELMTASIEEIRRRGCDVIWLGVWERNPRAIAFYRKFGFEAVGEHVFPVGNDPQRDVVMARRATA